MSFHADPSDLPTEALEVGTSPTPHQGVPLRDRRRTPRPTSGGPSFPGPAQANPIWGQVTARAGTEILPRADWDTAANWAEVYRRAGEPLPAPGENTRLAQVTRVQ